MIDSPRSCLERRSCDSLLRSVFHCEREENIGSREKMIRENYCDVCVDRQKQSIFRFLNCTLRLFFHFFGPLSGCAVALVVVEVFFAEADGFWSHLHIFIFADPLDRLFKR